MEPLSRETAESAEENARTRGRRRRRLLSDPGGGGGRSRLETRGAEGAAGWPKAAPTALRSAEPPILLNSWWARKPMPIGVGPEFGP